MFVILICKAWNYVDLTVCLQSGTQCRPKRILVLWSTMQTYVCTVGTVRLPFRILLVPRCCGIKLACTVADNSVSFLGH